MTLTHISLFSGIGGDSLAAEWAGFESLLFVEIDPFCQKVLNKNFPGVPIIGDVHDVTRETVANAYNTWKQQSERCEQNIGGWVIDRNQTEITTYSESVKEYSRRCGNVATETPEYELFTMWASNRSWLKYRTETTDVATFEYYVTPEGNVIRVTVNKDSQVTAISK